MEQPNESEPKVTIKKVTIEKEFKESDVASKETLLHIIQAFLPDTGEQSDRIRELALQTDTTTLNNICSALGDIGIEVSRPGKDEQK